MKADILEITLIEDSFGRTWKQMTLRFEEDCPFHLGECEITQKEVGR